MKRHTCIICKRKRYFDRMQKAFLNSYVCNDNILCRENEEIKIAKEIISLSKSLKKVNKIHLFGR